MSKIKSLDDLRKMRERVEGGLNIRERGDSAESITQIRVGMATCGIAAGARDTMSALLEKIEKEEITAVVTQTGCMGYCYAEPTVEVTVPGKEPVVFSKVDKKLAEEVVDRYIIKGELLDGIIPVNYQTIKK